MRLQPKRAVADGSLPSVLDFFYNDKSFADYAYEWAHESNPWREAFRDSQGFEMTALKCFAGYLLIHAVAIQLGRRAGAPLSLRPTVIASTLHASSVSAIAIYLLLFDASAEYRLWQTLALPLSLSYFVADACWYCVPKGDGLILFHHLVMCVCHYPVGSGAGARLAGAGDARWVVWLSMMGYLSEVSNPLMNYRWWLIHTLDAHKARFAVVNALIVVSFALRIVLMGYLLAFEIVPRTALYVDRKQVLTFVLCVLGHSVILALSMYWLKVLCSAGVRGLLVFRKPERARSGSGGGAAGGFSFGADMGRNAPSAEGGEAKAAPPAAPGSPALSAANGAPVTAEELAEREAAAEFTRRTRKRDIIRRVISRSNLWLQGKLFGVPDDAGDKQD